MIITAIDRRHETIIRSRIITSGTHLFEKQFTKVRGSVKADHAAVKIVFLPFQSFPLIIVDSCYLRLQLRATILELLYEGVNF